MTTVFETIATIVETTTAETTTATAAEDQYYVNGFGERKLKPKFVKYEIELMNDAHYYFGSCFTTYEMEMKDVLACDSCCERHQKNKPSLTDLNLPNMFNGIYEQGENRRIDFDVECGCNCRHNARAICFNNHKKYNMLKDLIRGENTIEIKKKSEIRDLFQKPFYEKNLPYYLYDENIETPERDINGDVEVWEITYKYLIRIDGHVYDVQVCHSSFEESYLDGLGVDPTTGRNIGDDEWYNDILTLLSVAMVVDDDSSPNDTIYIDGKHYAMIEEQQPKARKIYRGGMCIMCKAKSGIRQFYYDYCSLDCVNRDQSTWTDFGESSDEEDGFEE